MSPKQDAVEDRLKTLEIELERIKSAKTSLTELRLTMGQFMTALVVTLGILSVQLANAAISVAAFMIQNDRTATVTTALANVVKEQRMSDEKRQADYDKITAIINAAQKGTRR